MLKVIFESHWYRTLQLSVEDQILILLEMRSAKRKWEYSYIEIGINFLIKLNGKKINILRNVNQKY